MTPLPRGPQNLGDGGLEAFVGICHHPLDAAHASAPQGPQEVGPEGLGLRRHDSHAQNFPLTLGVDRHGDDHGHWDDAPGLAGLHIGGIQP